MESLINGQFLNRVTKDIYASNPDFFKRVLSYDKKSGHVEFREVLVKKAAKQHSVSAEGNSIKENSDVKITGTGSGGPATTDELDRIFQEAAEKYNVDVRLLKAIGKVESGFNPDSVSSAGAMGIMQLMPANVKEAGITDPFDPRQNIMAGAEQIAGLLKKYDGDLDLALAGYNAGPGNVSKYGGVPPFPETRNYIKKVRHYMDSQGTLYKVANMEETTRKMAHDKALMSLKMAY